MIRIGIVDDNKDDLNTLLNNLDDYRKKYNYEVKIESYDSPLKFLNEYDCRFDVLFLDIEMPLMTGIELAKKIRTLDKFVLIIFVTNLAQYAIKAFEVEAFDYIVKPVNYYSFTLKMNRIFARCYKENNNSLLINYENTLIKVAEDDIFYLETDSHYTIVYTKENTYRVYSTLKKIVSNIHSKTFIATCRSFFVNLKYVIGIKGDNCIITNGKNIIELPISRPQKKSFISAYANYISSTGRV